MYGYGYGYYSSMIFLLPAMIFAFYAQSKVKSSFSRYLKIRNMRGYSGVQVARMILDRNGLRDVNIEHIGGQLSDHYDPRKRVVRLSGNVYNGTSIASISVAAHEVGHAIQHATGYAALGFRNSLAPVASFASQFAIPLAFLGFFLRTEMLITLGIYIYIAAIAFHVITLPVEFNASSRAIKQLTSNGLIYNEEVKSAKSVLNAAALTYVAAVAVSIANLLRLLVLRNSRD
ncbi:zinc metallopeptidase [Wukongibacter sp. M2B1]|uniref:zinc metallopeptidase n=1 Tax=Wukongibacter sp. M2B1 TaxID=3088895 RepID=UPI003D797A41